MAGVTEGPENLAQARSVFVDACAAHPRILGSQDGRSLAVLDPHEMSLLEEGQVGSLPDLAPTRLVLSRCRHLSL
ncbi:hypothetical protein AB0937_00755 [Streptomyces sp. NPDC047880]|uniref:hypothetical protein n=1 Tax=Streptomyces sp. NPDC047880 TaxID=3155626 RepID=UPI0034570459